MRLTVVILAVALTCSASDALAYCSAPSPPSSLYRPTKPIEPSVPWCVNKWDNSHTCDDWQIDSYNRDVRNYNDGLRRYQSDVDDYVRQLQMFADEAFEYAKCEVRDLD